MAGNLDYRWRLVQKSWSLSFPTLGPGRLFSFFGGWDVTFGIWIHTRTDRVKPVARETSVAQRNAIQTVYQPLTESEIRLFILEPGSGTEPLRGRLVNVALSEALRYEALSYCWGTLADAEPILVNDIPVVVTDSIKSALLQLRHRDLSRILWIDSICINQHDIAEKSSQVRIMRSIYAHAAQVLIWLGPETEHSSAGMEILAYLANGPSPEQKPSWETQSPILLQAGLADIMGRHYSVRLA